MRVGAAPIDAEVIDRSNVIHVIQGEFRVSSDPSVLLTTILGSCVAACLFDAEAGVGGMNHFLLPGDENSGDDDLRYGVHAMELLINGLLRLGARRERLRAKLFGGARVVSGLSDVGEKNKAFAQDFLVREGIVLEGSSLGGDYARRVQFWPTSGRARQIRPSSPPPQLVHSELVSGRSKSTQNSGDLELF